MHIFLKIKIDPPCSILTKKLFIYIFLAKYFFRAPLNGNLGFPEVVCILTGLVGSRRFHDSKFRRELATQLVASYQAR